jgi:hypothetical protein
MTITTGGLNSSGEKQDADMTITGKELNQSVVTNGVPIRPPQLED